MGAIIEAVKTARPGVLARWLGRYGSIDLASEAAKRVLAATGGKPAEVELLINTGIYRDQNICEPAIAPFIQRKIGANVSLSKGAERSTFSFDLSNGACGLLNALEVVDGFVQSGKIEKGMVVTSDIDPTPRVSQGWRFEPVGAAILLSSGDRNEGFSAFHSETFGKYSHLFESRVSWIGGERLVGGRRSGGNHALRMRQSREFAATCARCAEIALDHFFEHRGLTLHDLDLIVPSHYPKGFPTAIASKIGMPRDQLVEMSGRVARSHTAGPALALEVALEDERYRGARNLLLIAVGSGISVSLALYRYEAGRRSPVQRA